MTDARSNILERLRQSSKVQPGPRPEPSLPAELGLEERIEQFTLLLESVRGKVRRVKADAWMEELQQVLDEHQVKRLLIAPTRSPGKEIAEQPPQGVEISHYDRPVEDWKSELFNQIDAAVTGTLGGIAETGTLILWPTPQEPRLMSLVPPLHIAVLDAGNLHGSFAQVISEQGWAQRMPTNALLISGPSKTADIEQVLAYGVHGPKDLVVILRE